MKLSLSFDVSTGGVGSRFERLTVLSIYDNLFLIINRLSFYQQIIVMTSIQLIGLIALLFFTCSGCAREILLVKNIDPAPYAINGKIYYPMKRVQPGFSIQGTASWYGPSYHGRKTASGEVYNMHALTAAHKTLPLNTLVRVTNLANGRDVVVRVNDRGPFVGDRVIDLSFGAAKQIGMVRPGTAPVRVAVIGPEKPNLAFKEPALSKEDGKLHAPNPYFRKS
jgi:rare lipoprotein A (peptidoglycan hydrolase)